jgi:hypothetical protein
MLPSSTPLRNTVAPLGPKLFPWIVSTGLPLVEQFLRDRELLLLQPEHEMLDTDGLTNETKGRIADDTMFPPGRCCRITGMLTPVPSRKQVKLRLEVKRGDWQA